MILSGNITTSIHLPKSDQSNASSIPPMRTHRTNNQTINEPKNTTKKMKKKATELLSRPKQTSKIYFCSASKLASSITPEEIKALFGQYSDNGIMSLGHLHKFLVEIQKQDKATLEDAQALVDLENLNISQHKGLGFEAFFTYLFGDSNPPIDLKRRVHQDMTAPLSHYFIYTGHNSYLTGNQLTSDCSDEPIIRALQKGVRVIELDIWPNSAKDDVDVLHGRTLTTPVKLIQCLRSIKDYAFTASEYPVVITFEDHLKPDLQAKVAEMVTKTFGDTLFTPGEECLKEIPSPESLKKRVFISTKPPKEYLQAKEVKKKESVPMASPPTEMPPTDVKCWGRIVSDLKFRNLTHSKMELEESEEEVEEDEDEDDDDDDNDRDEEDLDEEGHKSQNRAAPEYKCIITIRAGKPKGGLDACLLVDPEKVRRLSLSEKQLLKAVETHGKQIVRFTQRNILRVYPKGVRIDSSNYNPLLGWAHGAQMVAFNMQGYGRSLWLMHGMFRANGGCGYVKKPEFLLKCGPNGETFDPITKLPVKKTLKVKLYMGEGWKSDFSRRHFDTFSPPDFYARVGIAGVPADTIKKKTEVLEDNWTPIWNEEFEFPLTVPELALLWVEIHEDDVSDDDFGGQTCLPVWELQEGIRAVPLYDEEGEKYPSVKLLMRFEFV